jgi:transcriptional regulator of NAD metabolism
MQQISITQLSPEDLKSLVTKILQNELSGFKNEMLKSDAEVFHTREETANRFRINLSTLHRWTKAGIIISHAIGGRVFYKESSIQQALVKLDPNQNIKPW